MPDKSSTSKSTVTFNKYGLHLRWPRIWIIILGLILLFLCLSIAGMEIGHTVFDVHRSTAFGGFILFIPLMICAIFILITAYKPRLILLRVAAILCYIMILLCVLLIAYDIVVLIDPTRCFFLNCDDADVYISNSTNSAIFSGWPLYITWPNYFQTNMNAKRIFQSIQILCAALFILFASLYLLTYFIYRHIRLHQQTLYNADRRTFTRHETRRTSPTRHETRRTSPARHETRRTSPTRHETHRTPTTKSFNSLSQSYPRSNPYQSITTYTVEGQPYTSAQYHHSPTPAPPPPVTTTITPRQTEANTFVRPRSNSLNYDRLCSRCNQEPRMIIRTDYERQNYFPNLCTKCNHYLANDRHKRPLGQLKHNPPWRP